VDFVRLIVLGALPGQYPSALREIDLGPPHSPDLVATLDAFLDNALNVRLFTSGSNKVFKLIRSDVGRPITDIASDLFYSGLADDARQVLRTLLAHEKEVTTRDGRWFLMRIMLYRTLENMIEGVVITFMDVTVSKTLEAKLRETQAGLHKQIIEQGLKLEQRGHFEEDAELTTKSEKTRAAPLRK